MDRLDIRRANWLDFCELDESTANIIGTNPIYYNLLPAAKKAKWMRSGDGVLLASPGNHLTNAMAFGKVNFDDVEEEYKAIKGGAKIRYDNDLYYVSEIEGYDPSGYNLTSLKLIKKT